MFYDGVPHQEGYPRQYAPRGPTSVNQLHGPTCAFLPQFGAVSSNLPPGPPVPCGPFVEHQHERDLNPFHQIYHTNPEECRRSPPWRRYPPRHGNSQGPDSRPPAENICKQLNPSLHHAGFSIDQTQMMSMGNNPTGSSAYTQCSQLTGSRRGNPFSQEHFENERASEEFLRRLAAKEKYPVPDGAADRGDPHFRPPCPGNERGQELCADNHMYKRPSPARGKSRGRSKSRPRSRSRSRGKSRGRSKSRPRSRSCSRGKSRGRSKSRPRSRSRSQGKSRGGSKSRPRIRSRSRGKSQGRRESQPRSRSHTQGKSPSKSCHQRWEQGPSQSWSSSDSGDTSRRVPPPKRAAMDLLQELVLTGQCKEKEDPLTTSKMSAIKKQLDTENHRQGSTQSSDSPVEVSRECQSSSLSRETERFLNAVTRGKESGLFSSILGEMREDRRVQTLRQGLNVGQYKEILSRVKQATEAGEGLLPHERVRQDNSGFSRILGLMGNPLILQKNSKIFMDIEDEEKFLYGDEDDEHDQNKVLIRTESGSNAGIKDHSAVGSCRKQNRQSPPMTVTSETDRGPGTSQQHPPLDSCGPGETRERQDFVDFERIKKALQTIGLDLGVEEVIKMARMQERRAGPVTGSPQHKRASSLMNHSRSHSRSPSQSHTRKRNRSPNPEKYPASSPPTKQALCSGAPTGFVWSALDMDVQGKQVPFFEPDTLQPPVTVNMQPFPIVSEAAVLGHAQLQTANYWPQNPHFQSPHGPTMEHQVPSATDFAYERVHEKIAIGQLQGLGPLKQALASMKATTKASKMDTLVDFSKQSAQVRTGYLQRTPEQNAKVNEDGEALKAEIQVQLRRNESLMKELEVFLKQQGTEFLVPVMGFYCRLCEEFFGDITSAQDHATCDSHKEKCKKHADGHFKGRTILNFQGRSVDTDKQGLRQFDHKSRSKEESQGYRKDTEPVSVKEDKLETTRQVKVVSGPSSAKAVTSKRRERKEEEAKGSDHDEDTSSKAPKKKKKKKEKKQKKKKMKKEKKRKD